MEPKELAVPDLIFPIPSVLYGRQGGWYRKCYSANGSFD